MQALSAQTSFQVTYDAAGRILSITDCDGSGACTDFAFDVADRIGFDGLSVDDIDFDHLLSGVDDPAKEAGSENEGEVSGEDGTGTGTGTGGT